MTPRKVLNILIVTQAAILVWVLLVPPPAPAVADGRTFLSALIFFAALAGWGVAEKASRGSHDCSS